MDTDSDQKGESYEPHPYSITILHLPQVETGGPTGCGKRLLPKRPVDLITVRVEKSAYILYRYARLHNPIAKGERL